jgi:hypothetical protein
MVSGTLKKQELLANLPHPGRAGNLHGESIMIDPGIA